MVFFYAMWAFNPKWMCYDSPVLNPRPMITSQNSVLCDPLPVIANADALRVKYPTFAKYSDGVLEVVFGLYNDLRTSPQKLSLALTVIKSALIAFGKTDGDGYRINEMSLRLFADHIRQIVHADL